ncbi:MAG TPA: hypothetical protein VIW29_00260 [Polyangiaceae bacterium]
MAQRTGLGSGEAAALAIALVLGLRAAPGRAQGAELRPLERPAAPAPAPQPDRFELVAESHTYLQLFQRALLPGANGAIVTTDTAAPLTEYLSARADAIDAPWQKDGLDLQFAAWGQLWPTSSDYERPFDGDVQSANVRLRLGNVWLRLGRQQEAGGAARFSRFDGAGLGAQLGRGTFLTAYGGAVVLPRWNARTGYHHLGKAESDLTSYEDVDLDRTQHWLAGAKLAYRDENYGGTLSFHEQHATGGVAHRNLGLDVGGRLAKPAWLGAKALYEVDGQRWAEVRGWLDLDPHELVHASIEGLRTEPSAFLSRQSVLSVFSTSGYEELGGFVSVDALTWLRLEGSGFLEFYDEGEPGARGEAAARFALSKRGGAFTRFSYQRVIIGENGYQALRASLAGPLLRRLAGTLEAYAYFYDEPIQGYSESAVFAGTLSYEALDNLSLLWGASLARSPYASLDAQTMLRASFTFDAKPRERAW